ncbi:MAG: hypothetical protein A2V64_03490 [Bacteroidetes bacterium RBG_13_43_22]|nr:MAG: hypothetical protein A2V64_03490 [Bacteroidetes bacterium RBG_13_43_22]
MRIRYKGILIILLLLPGMLSCRKNPYIIDVSSVSADIEVNRLEKDLFSIDPAEIAVSMPVLREKYGSFLQLFSYVINTGNVNDSSFSGFLGRFCTDKINNEVYESVMRLYPDVEAIEEEMEESFRHYKWYFPQSMIPAVYTCITGFNNSLIIGDSVIGIGLDRYLGRDSDYYKRLQIYRYLAARMNSWNIVPDCLYGWGASEWDFASMGYPVDDVMTEIVHEGKLKYFQKCMMPELNDTVLFGFSDGQMKFCRNNEMQMWQYLIEHDLLFSTDQFTIRKLTGEAPFTTFFTNESPGRAAAWIGFRIVESYMMNNRSMTLGEMMDNTDIQGILEKARYIPE